MFKALADETRMRLASILFYYELSVNELVQILGMGQSRVSRHLKILAEAGLLRSRRDGLWVFYSVPKKTHAYEFLRAVLPFFPGNAAKDTDLYLAVQMLEERARKTRQFFNSIADDWDELNREVLGDLNLGQVVVAAMPPDCNVAVDLGCGTGVVLKQLAAESRVAIGVDGSARMLERCRTRLGAQDLADGAVSLRIGELSHLPLADHEADFACINLVLHHLGRPFEIFSEVHRVLTLRGRLFIADFKRHTDEDMRQRYGDHWLGFDPEEIEKELQGSGFRILSRESQPVGKNLEIFFLTAAPVPE